jgi:poly [ADP-ribose] polymerase
MMSKSANYSYASLSQHTGLLLLAEVAVAPFNDLTMAKYNADEECKAKDKLCVTSSSIPLRPPHLSFFYFLT